MSVAEESDLLARCRHGDADAWDCLFDAHYSAAGRFIFQLSPGFSAEDVEEICQETFLSVIRSLNTFHGQCRFQTWLFRIAVNKARDYRERQQAAKRGGGQTPLPLDARDPETGRGLDPPAGEPAPDVLLMSAERVQLVHEALERLGEPCREVIELRYFADLSYEEIGSSLLLNMKTVSSRLSKCLDKLEHILKANFGKEKTLHFPSNK